MESMNTSGPENEEEIKTPEFSPEEEEIIREITEEPLPELEEGLRTDFARGEGDMLRELTKRAGEDPDEPGALEKLAHSYPGLAKGLRVFMLGTIFAGGMGSMMKPEDAAAQRMRFTRPAATLSVPAAQEAAILRMEQAGRIQVESAARSETARLESRARAREARVEAYRYQRDVAPIYRVMARNNQIDAEIAREQANNAYMREVDPKFRAVDDAVNTVYGGMDKVLSFIFPLPSDEKGE
ncbi:MAG: hypothetical protein O2794_02140 [bacterium]|nr:hypothetical protein [bacterium]